MPDLSDKEYVAQLKARMQDRLNYVTRLDTEEGGFNKLPEDAAAGQGRPEERLPDRRHGLSGRLYRRGRD